MKNNKNYRRLRNDGLDASQRQKHISTAMGISKLFVASVAASQCSQQAHLMLVSFIFACSSASNAVHLLAVRKHLYWYLLGMCKTFSSFQGSRQSDIPWRCALLHVLAAPFQIRRRHASKCLRHSFLTLQKDLNVHARYTSSGKTVAMGTWHAFIRK